MHAVVVVDFVLQGRAEVHGAAGGAGAGAHVVEGVLAVFPADVAAVPDAGADPDGNNADDDDDNEDDPLPVVVEPVLLEAKLKHKYEYDEKTYQELLPDDALWDDFAVEVDADVPVPMVATASPSSEQNEVNQLRMLARSLVWVARVQASSQTPAVPVEKGVR